MFDSEGGKRRKEVSVFVEKKTNKTHWFETLPSIPVLRWCNCKKQELDNSGGWKQNAKRMQFFRLKSSDPLHAWISFSCKPDRWGGTQLGERKWNRECGRNCKTGKKVDIWETAAAPCLVFQDGWCQKSAEAAPGIRSLEGGKTCGRGRGQAQHGMWQKPRICWGWSSETPLAQRFLQLLFAKLTVDFWNFTSRRRSEGNPLQKCP